MENLTGKQLGPYRVTAPLGEGGMAAVYKAYQAGMDRYVALKVLPQQLAADPQFVGRFRQEAQVLAKLQHPHILPVFDFGEAEGYTYIVMPFVESGELTNLLTGKPLPLAQIRDIASQVGDALDYAHSLGLIHRDVKPSNVLIDKRGNCLLTDFGIAKIVEGASRFTNTGGIVGTPAYMSPEQGRGGKVDVRTDIYALGVMLYEMVTGRVPFDAETPIAIVFKHISDPLPMPSLINPNVPDGLERVILKALAKDPEERFGTAGEMVQAIKAALPDSVTMAGTAAASQSAPPPRTRVAAPSGTMQPPRAPTGPTPPVAPSNPPAARKGSPVWIVAIAAILLVALCVGLGLGGLALRGFQQARAAQTATALAAATSTPSATASPITPTPTATTASAVGESSVTVVEAAHIPAEALSTVDSYLVVVGYTLGADKGVLEVWMDGFADPECQEPISNDTLYYTSMPVEKGSDTLKLELTGAPTTAQYLSANARLSDETIANQFAQDADHVPCVENVTPTPVAPDINSLLGTWTGNLIETTGDLRTFTLKLVVEPSKDSSSGFLGTLTVYREGSSSPFNTLVIVEGKFDGSQFQFREADGRHYSGLLEGDQMAGVVAWDCYDCSPWGIFSLERSK